MIQFEAPWLRFAKSSAVQALDDAILGHSSRSFKFIKSPTLCMDTSFHFLDEK